MYGIDLQDTQTGLRGIPLSDKLLELKGDRYEYEGSFALVPYA